MRRQSRTSKSRPKIELYWIIIAILALAAAILFIYHQVSGETPSRIALHIEMFNFDIFWYGIIIVAGIGLGAYVTSRLASERAESAFADEVPILLRREPVSALELPNEIERRLRKHGTETMGTTLYRWGLNPQLLNLNRSQREILFENLKDYEGVKEQWLIDAPWRQWNPDYVWGGIVWVLVLGIIGARLYHVLTPSPSMAEIGINSALDYFRNPIQLVNLRSGGLGIYGAVAGGLLGLFIYSRRQHISLIAWADLAAVGLALGQAIGRWGNFFNQELYGNPVDLPWAVTIDPANRLSGYTQYEQFHPAFLYASLWSLLTFVILLRLARRHRKQLYTGDLTAVYFLLFSIGRILLELVRLDSRSFTIGALDFGLPVATVVSIVLALAAAAYLLWRHVLSSPSTKVAVDD